MDDLSSYLPGGADYAKVVAKYGQSAADTIATAARSGDQSQVNAAFATVLHGPALDSSTLDALGNQLADPLAAPLSGLNKLLGNTFFSFLKNPWVLLTIGGVIFVFVFDGVAILKRKFN
jgi:hypothetical protein